MARWRWTPAQRPDLRGDEATPEGLYIRRFTDDEPQLVPGSAGASAPVFSPDGRAVAYFDIDDLIIRRVDVEGGAPSNVCTLCGRVSAMHWYDDAWIAYSQQPGDIMCVPASGGGNPEPLVRIDPDFLALGPHVLPGGEAVIFTQAPGAGRFSSDPVLVLQRLPVGERLELVRGGSDGRFHPPTGHLLYARGPTLFAVPFDPVDPEVRRLDVANPDPGDTARAGRRHRRGSL